MTMMMAKNGGFIQQQQQQQQNFILPDVPNFEPINVHPEISNFSLPNSSQQNLEPPNVDILKRKEENPSLQQIDIILGKQVKIKKPKTEIDPNLGNFLIRQLKFLMIISLKNENQRELNASLDLNQVSETLNRGQMPEELKSFYGGENDNFLTRL